MMFHDWFGSTGESSCYNVCDDKYNSSDVAENDCDLEPSGIGICNKWSDIGSEASSNASVDSNASCCEKDSNTEDGSVSVQTHVTKSFELPIESETSSTATSIDSTVSYFEKYSNSVDGSVSVQIHTTKSLELHSGSEASSTATSIASTVSYCEKYSSSEDGSLSVQTSNTASLVSRSESEALSNASSATSTAFDSEKDINSEDESVTIQTDSTASLGLIFDDGCAVNFISWGTDEERCDVSLENSTISLARTLSEIFSSDSHMIYESSTEDEDMNSKISFNSTNSNESSTIVNTTDGPDINRKLNFNIEIVKHPLSNNSQDCLLVFQSNLAKNLQTVYEV